MIAVAGGSGQVGRWLAELGGPEVVALTSSELDVTDGEAASAILKDLAPKWVINCAAHTAVDAAEAEPELAAAINSQGAENLARAASSAGAKFIQVSTDYVFGESNILSEPLVENHLRAPMSVYGKTKSEGEDAVRAVCEDSTIIRTAWVYSGPGRSRLGLPGSDFVTTMMALESSRDTLTVVNDQYGSPTFAHDLAVGLLQLVKTGAGVGSTMHAAGGGRATWFELARAVFEESDADPERIRPCTTKDFPRPAPRPAYSVLSSQAWRCAGLPPLRNWREALSAAMATR
ncbi:dTDP-4-dehydrorhamnose reductase [Dietzia sp. Die43]|uniref:dTDP-4-dehydrorhamnose reductase n=1 Tax=Dietzia sp. Die43 TaxID=2926011 RepID=UPI002118C6D1|nr:dTDP-4-dehydrorhamnose reductase [Dietzia sp. Die43]